MKRILRHVGGKDFRKTHQKKLDEQRALYFERREKEIQEQQYLEELKRLSSPFKSDWRSDLFEGMTTSGLVGVTLPATGDVEYSPQPGEENTVEVGPYVSASATFDTSRYDTMIVDVTVNDPSNVFAVLDADENFLFTTFDGSGTYSFSIPQSNRTKNQLFYFAGPDEPDVPDGTNVFNVTAVRFKRRSPLSAFVSLDSPEATNFIRTDPIMRGLSAEERRKRLEDMLDAGDEYLLKQLGMQGSKARPADTGNVQSWEQAAGDDWSPNSPTRIEFEKEIAYLNSITDNSFDKMGHYYAPNGMVYPWPPGSSGKTAGLQPGPEYDKQVADNLSKSVDAARAEYLKSGQTVAQRQQSYDKLQAAIKAGTDYANVFNNPNIASRALRSVTDQIRFSGVYMYQGNPAGRSPGLSNYWSPDPATAGTYSNPGAGKGVPGARPNSTGTLTSAPRPANTPRVTRSPLGQPQFKFPAGSPPPAKMITQMADDAAVAASKKVSATTASKTLSRVVPGVSIGIAAADAAVRASRGDYAGAVLSGISAVPGPIGWTALGVQIVTDVTGATGVKEQKEFANYGDYLKNARNLVKKYNLELDRNAMLDAFLREISKTKQLSNKDKEFLVAIFTDAEGLEKDDVITFVKKIQRKLSDNQLD